MAEPGEKALLLTFDAPPYDPKKTVKVEPTPREKYVENRVQGTHISPRRFASERG